MLAASGLLSMALASAIIFFSLAQPWLGLLPRIDPARGEIVTVAGDRLRSIDGIVLTGQDLVEEPDTIETYDEHALFFARQTALFRTLHKPDVSVVSYSAGGEKQETKYRVARTRPLASLPFTFWLQLIIGVTSMLIGSWVWSFRRSDLAAMLVQTIGFGVFLMTGTAAIYSAREIALDGDIFRWLAIMDHLGAYLIGVPTLILFLSYPARIVPPWLLCLTAAAGAASWLADSSRSVFAGPPTGFYLPFLIMLALFGVATVVQFRRARRQPQALAALRWMALSFVVGTGSFVLSTVIPNIIGSHPVIPQAYAFVFLIAIFIGIAIGVARHNLFALEDWAFTVLYYFGAVSLLLTLDAVLISAVALDKVPAFGISLLVIGLLYIPARVWLARRILPARSDMDRDTMFAQLVDVVLTNDRAEQRDRWTTALLGVFDPLTIEQAQDGGGSGAQLLEDGLKLHIPSVAAMPAMVLGYGFQGRRLFTPRDQRRADDLRTMVLHLIERRDAREQGATEERSRIMRDMHDNIGAQLLSALRSPSADRKDAIIGDALGDLRSLISESGQLPRSFEEALAEIRIETAERLADAGLAMEWNSGSVTRASPTPQVLHELRSVIREAVSNTIKHAHARRMRFDFTDDHERIRIEIVDDGAGIDPLVRTRGSGLANMETRLRGLSGTLRFAGTDGFRLTASLPVPTGADT